MHVWKNIKYQTSERCVLDVYSSTTKDKCTIICMHGGSWILSSKNSASGTSRILSEHNFTVVTPSYRVSAFATEDIYRMTGLQFVLLTLSSPSLIMLVLFTLLLIFIYVVNSTTEPPSQHPRHAQDLASVVKWTYDNITDYGGDPNKIFLVGHSAGGHLVTLVANNTRFLRELGLSHDVIKGVVALSGVFSDVRLAQTAVGRQILRLVFGKRPEYYDAFPIWHCRPSSPPHLLINADIDFSLKRHTLDFFVALRTQDVAVETFVAPGTTHFSIHKNWTTDTNDITLCKILDFIHRRYPPTGRS